MKVVLAVSSLRPGGAERVISIMANYWAGKGWDITLITLDNTDLDFYQIDQNVTRIALGAMVNSSNLWQAIKNNARRLWVLRRAINNAAPEAVISFVDRMNILTLIASLGLRYPIVISERTDPRQHEIGRVWQWLRRCLYWRARGVVVQTESVRCWAEHIVPSERVYVVPNPVAPIVHDIGMDREEKWPDNFILAVGRLDMYKGFDLLLQAFAVTSEKNRWFLVILGEGRERAALQSLAEKLGVKKRVLMPGVHAMPFSVMQQAKLFVLSSRYEGFPNVLIEAMASGLPVISFDCPSGPGEIIHHGENGVLVPAEKVEHLSTEMSRLMTDAAERKRLAIGAREAVKRYKTENVMGIWESLLMQVVAGKNRGTHA